MRSFDTPPRKYHQGGILYYFVDRGMLRAEAYKKMQSYSVKKEEVRFLEQSGRSPRIWTGFFHHGKAPPPYQLTQETGKETGTDQITV
jgi:hypothetical protein